MADSALGPVLAKLPRRLAKFAQRLVSQPYLALPTINARAGETEW